MEDEDDEDEEPPAVLGATDAERPSVAEEEEQHQEEEQHKEEEEQSEPAKQSEPAERAEPAEPEREVSRGALPRECDQGRRLAERPDNALRPVVRRGQHR